MTPLRKLKEGEARAIMGRVAPTCTHDADGNLVSMTEWFTAILSVVHLVGRWDYGIPVDMAVIWHDAMHAELRKRGAL